MAIIPKQKTIAEAFTGADARTWARPLPFSYPFAIDPIGSSNYDPITKVHIAEVKFNAPDPTKLIPKVSVPITPMTNQGYRQYLHSQKDLNGTAQDLKDKSKSSVGEKRDMPNLRPAVDVLNYVLANRNINKIRDEQLARKNLYLPTPSLSVRPIQDLSPEVLAAQQEALAQNRSEYAGSDPAMSVIAKNIAAANRNKMRSEQIAGRAAAIAGERGRFDEQTRMNQQAAADTANKNIEREQDFMDYRTGVKTAALDSKNKLNSYFLNQIGTGIDAAAQYNMQAEAIDRDNARTKYEDMLKSAYMEGMSQKGREEMLLAAEKFWAPYAAKPLLTYGQAQAGAISRGPIGGILDRLLGSRNK